MRGRSLRRSAIKQLRIANQLFEEGRWQAAAEQFERLATAAVKRGLPQAPQLTLRAGQARLENGDHAAGLLHLNRAIDLFAQFGQVHRLNQIRPRILGALHDHGLEREAVELDQSMHAILDQHRDREWPAAQSTPAQRFPTKCTSCGANLRPDELELIDSRSAMCGYCGSVNVAE